MAMIQNNTCPGHQFRANGLIKTNTDFFQVVKCKNCGQIIQKKITKPRFLLLLKLHFNETK